MSHDLIPTTPRPNRHARRAAEAVARQQAGGSVQQVPAQGVPVQVGIAFGHNDTHMVMILTLGNQQIPVPMTADQWETLAANGDTVAEALRAAQAAAAAVPAEAEPDPVYDDDAAVLIRQRAEDCAVSYGKYLMDQRTVRQAFRHQNHMVNWAAKHRIDFELEADNSAVTFYPATSAAIPLPGPTVETPTAV